MNGLTRRRFLLASGAAAVAATAAGVGWKDLADRTRSDPLPVGTGVLVLVTLYGGNDGLNTVVPAADPAYQSARPDLAYAPSEVLDIGEGLGLNPGLAGLKQQWDNGTLAIVRGVSYPKPDHSHFRSMDIWQTASPGPPRGHRVDRPLAGRERPRPAVRRLAGAGAAADAGGRDHRGRRAAAARARAADAGRSRRRSRRSGSRPRASRRCRPTRRARSPTCTARSTRSARTSTRQAKPPATSSGRARGPARRGGALRRGGRPARVYSVSLGGFDTHADERGTQQRLLTEVDQAVSGFLTRMAGTDRGRGVVLMAYSEFGRRVAANANEGTDHGTAGPVFVAGAPVKGGFVGEQPSLTDLDNGDLKPTTDFRDVYATLLADVLNADPAPILGPGRTTLPLLSE